MFGRERQEQIKKLGEQTLQLCHKRDELIHQILAIDEKLRSVQAETAKLAPIHYVPSEIMSLVFEFGYRQPRYKGHTSFPVTVSHVSRRWRSIALNTPVIWTYLCLTGEKPPEYVSTLLTRSRQRTIDIILDCTSPPNTWRLYKQTDQWHNVEKYIELLVAHVNRWRRFSVFTTYPEVIVKIREALPGIALPRLQYLQLVSTEPYTNTEPFLTGGLPSLRCMRFTNIGLPLSSHFAQGLTELFLATKERQIFSFTALRALLSRSPSLTMLSLSCISFVPPYTDLVADKSPIPALCLRHLILDNIDDIYELLNMLHMPSLSHLELSQVSSIYFNELLQRLKDEETPIRFPAVDTLCISHMPGSMHIHDLDSSFIATFPALTHLAIIDADPEVFMEVLNVREQLTKDPYYFLHTPFWHRLSTISITNIDSDAECLKEVIAFRKDCARPITLLRLGSECAIDFGSIEWLRQHVRMEVFDVPPTNGQLRDMVDMGENGPDPVLPCPGHMPSFSCRPNQNRLVSELHVAHCPLHAGLHL